MLLAVATLIVWLLCLGAAVGVVRSRGLLVRVRRLVAAVAWAAVGIVLATLFLVLHAFHAFAGETLIGWVTTRRLAPEAFELIYVPAAGGDAAARTFQLHGDQWAISGGVVKWHPWLTALGLRSYHKPNRISGQFSSLERQRARPPTVEALEPDTDWFWELLYWADPSLPFVEAAYGSTAYVYVEPQWVQEVYVTPSGYLIKRVPKSLRPSIP